MDISMYDNVFKMSDIVEFLGIHTTAKLILILSTHSVDGSGAFVWGGTDETNLQTCFMYEVSVAWYPTRCILTHCLYSCSETVSQKRSGEL